MCPKWFPIRLVIASRGGMAPEWRPRTNNDCWRLVRFANLLPSGKSVLEPLTFSPLHCSQKYFPSWHRQHVKNKAGVISARIPGQSRKAFAIGVCFCQTGDWVRSGPNKLQTKLTKEGGKKRDNWLHKCYKCKWGKISREVKVIEVHSLRTEVTCSCKFSLGIEGQGACLLLFYLDDVCCDM